MQGFAEGYEFSAKNAVGVHGANIGYNHINSVNQEIEKLTSDINSFVGFKTDVSALKGDVAEFWHSGTHNIDAVIKGSGDRTFVDRSNEFASADITSNFGDSYGLKYYKSGAASAKEQAESVFQRYSEYKADAIYHNRSFQDLDGFLKERGYDNLDKILNDPIYSGQIRIIPKDQMNDAITWLERKIREESIKRPEQVQRYQDTLDLLRDKIKSPGGSESIALSKEDAESLAKLAKEGEFDPADFNLTTEELIKYKYVMQQALKAGISAATISMVLRIAPEVYKTIEYLIKHGEIDSKQFEKIGFAAVQGGAEGFIRGSVSAGITTACKAGLWGGSLKSIDPLLVAATTVIVMDVMKHSFLLAQGKITQGEFVDFFVRDMFISSCAMVLGGITQSIIEIPILGFMLGSFVGSIIGSFAYNTTYKAYLSFCVDSGFSFFGIVDQDYVLPQDLLNQIGIELFDYEKFEYNKFEYDKFEYNKFEYDKFEHPTIGIKLIRRGVIGVNRIGYV